MANKTRGRERKLKPSALQRQMESQRERDWFFFLFYLFLNQKVYQSSSKNCSLWPQHWNFSLGIKGFIHNPSNGWSPPPPHRLPSQCQSTWVLKRQTSEDQTRLILLQISPQEMGSAEDLMLLEAVVICLTAPFEGLTVNVTPGARGLGPSFRSGSCP